FGPSLSGPAGSLAEELECSVKIAVAGRHHQVERGIGETGTAVAAVTEILDALRHDREIAGPLLELTTARGLAPVRDRFIAAACGTALVETKSGHPAGRCAKAKLLSWRCGLASSISSRPPLAGRGASACQPKVCSTASICSSVSADKRGNSSGL